MNAACALSYYRFMMALQEFGVRVQGFGVRVQEFGVRVQEFSVRVQGFGVRVQGFGVRVQGKVVGCLELGWLECHLIVFYLAFCFDGLKPIAVKKPSFQDFIEANGGN